jgi:predicted ATP-grasp superfamily ATP-dependent carboligase
MIALVLADIPNFGFHAATCLGAAGVRVEIMCTHRRGLHRWSRYCRRCITIDRARLLGQDAGLADQIAAYVRARGVDVIVPVDLESALLLAVHRGRFDAGSLFPLASPELLQQMHEKPRFARVVAEAGVAQPRWATLNSPDELGSLGLAYPLVLKPPAAAAGYQVFVARTPDEAMGYLDSVGSYPRFVQEFIHGFDLDITTLNDRGRTLAWTIHRRLPDMSEEYVRHDGVLEAARRVIAHAAFHGAADFGTRVDERDGSVWMIECNPRFPGSLLYKLWGGVNLPYLGALLATGRDIGPMFTPIAGVCTDVAISPGRLVASLARGRLAPRGLTEGTRRCWIMNLKDPIPHLMRAVQQRCSARAARNSR